MTCTMEGYCDQTLMLVSPTLRRSKQFRPPGYIVLGAGGSLWAHHGWSFSVPGLIIAAVAMPITYGHGIGVCSRRGRGPRQGVPAPEL